MPDNCYTRDLPKNGATVSGVKSSEVSPMDVFFGKMAHNWKKLAAMAILGAVVATCAYYYVTPKWQANLLIQIGKVTPGGMRDGSLIEGVDQTAFRIRSRDFVDAVLLKVVDARPDGTGTEETSEIKLFRESLKSSEVRNTEFVNVTFLGYSKGQLEKYAAALTQELLTLHNRVPETLKKELQAESTKNKQELADAEVMYDTLTKDYNRLKQLPADQQLLPISILTSQIQNSASLVDALRSVQRDIDRRLFPSNLYSTTVLKVQIADKPVFPVLGVFLFIGVIAGLAVGLMFLIFRRNST